MTTKPLGVYIHVPFCSSKCFYCDFVSDVYDEKSAKSFVSIVTKEMKLRAESVKGFIVDSIFLGGGTPSTLSIEHLEAMILAVQSNYSLAKDVEFTIECNPESSSFFFLKSLKSLGINRISFGVQSFDDGILKALNRRHDKGSAILAFENARKAGFENISIDLMYSLPNQTLLDVESDLGIALSLAPEHISYYDLILAKGTVLHEQYASGLYKAQDEDFFVQANSVIKSTLLAKSYQQYEISNFAKNSGFESRHNKKYWDMSAYIAFGPSAHSYVKPYRYSNTADFEEYLQAGFEKKDLTKISKNEEALDYILFKLRMNEGICLKTFKESYGYDFSEKYASILPKLHDEGFLATKNGRIFLSDSGQNISNMILLNFLD